MNRVLSFVAAAGVAATLALPAAAFAQTAPTQTGPAPMTAPAARGQHHGRGSAYLRALRQLNLSDAQKQQVRQAMRSEQLALRKQIDGFLTPDQRTQLRSSLQQTRTSNPPPRT